MTDCRQTLFRLKAAKSVFGALLACLTLCGCTHYDVTLQNGDVVRAKTKPKLNTQGVYVFKDTTGRDVGIKSSSIRQIEPVRAGSPPSNSFIK